MIRESRNHSSPAAKDLNGGELYEFHVITSGIVNNEKSRRGRRQESKDYTQQQYKTYMIKSSNSGGRLYQTRLFDDTMPGKGSCTL